MAYQINPTKCISCGMCASVCPVMAITAAAGKYKIDAAACINCGTCASVCPMLAIEPVTAQ